MHATQAQERTRYGAIIPVMEKMGWSWNEVLSAPSDLVTEIVLRIAAEAEFEEKRRKMEKAKAK